MDTAIHTHISPGSAHRSSPNHLLASLPVQDYERLLPELTSRPMRPKDVLYRAGDRLAEVCFPGRSVCSIIQTMENGASIEIATIGNEGLVGVPLTLGEQVAMGAGVVQIQGEQAQVMGIGVFRRELGRRGALYDLVEKYSEAFVRIAMQSAACNGLHSAEARCCRWLLSSSDRLNRDAFGLTHDALAGVLGLRRPTVTLVLAELARVGIIAQSRAHVRIVDRAGLERKACECYESVKEIFHRMLS